MGTWIITVQNRETKERLMLKLPPLRVAFEPSRYSDTTGTVELSLDEAHVDQKQFDLLAVLRGFDAIALAHLMNHKTSLNFQQLTDDELKSMYRPLAAMNVSSDGKKYPPRLRARIKPPFTLDLATGDEQMVCSMQAIEVGLHRDDWIRTVVEFSALTYRDGKIQWSVLLRSGKKLDSHEEFERSQACKIKKEIADVYGEDVLVRQPQVDVHELMELL